MPARFPSRPSFRFPLLALLLAAAAPAQVGDGPHWSTLPLPAGQPVVKSIGTTVTVRTPGRILLYSGITRRWTVLPTSAGAAMNQFNAYVIVEDGTKVHGWTSRTGVVDTITTTASRRVLHGPSTSSWVSMVIDGNKAWGFSAFRGQWVPITLVGPGRTAVAAQLTGVVHDGVTAWGFGAHQGKWVSVRTADPSATVSVAGVVGIVRSRSVVRAFASQVGRWLTIPAPSTARLTMQRGYVLLEDASKVTAFSGYTGTASSLAVGGTLFQVTAGRNTAAVVAGNKVACYAAAAGSWRSLTIPSPRVDVNSELAVVSSSSSRLVVAFSGVTGRFSPALNGSFTISTDESVAFAKGSPDSFAYSPLLGIWVRAPRGTIFQATLLRNSVLLAQPGGFAGFTARYARWAKLASSPRAGVIGPRRGRGSTALVQDGGRVHAWDSRLGRWASVTVGASPNFAVFRVVAMAEDGNTGYGFGLFSSVWDTVPIQGDKPVIRASSSIGTIVTTTHVHVFTAHGTLSTPSRFPEFSRFQTRGSDLRLIQVAPAGSAVTMLIGVGPDSRPTPLGTLFVSLTDPFAFVPAAAVPPSGRLDTTLRVPPDPSLSGQAVHIQDVIVPPTGLPYLTNSTAPVIV